MNNTELGAVVRRCKGLYAGLSVSALAGVVLGIVGVVLYPVVANGFAAVVCLLVFILARVYTPPAILFIIPCSCVLMFIGLFDMILLIIMLTGVDAEAYQTSYLASMGISTGQAVVGACTLATTLVTRSALMRVRVRVVHNAPLPGRAIKLIKCRPAEDCPAATAEGKEVIMVDNHAGLPHPSMRLDSLEFPSKQKAQNEQRTANIAAQEMLARVMGAFPSGVEICAAAIKEEIPVAQAKEDQDARRRRAAPPRRGRAEEDPPARPQRQNPPDSREFHLDYIRDRRKGPVADSAGVGGQPGLAVATAEAPAARA